MAFVSFCFQYPVNPESVEARFLDDDEGIFTSGSITGLALQLLQTVEKSRDVAAGDGVTR